MSMKGVAADANAWIPGFRCRDSPQARSREPSARKQVAGDFAGVAGVNEDLRTSLIIDQAADFIARHEGCHLHAYPDPASPLGRAIGQKGIDRIGRGGIIPHTSAHLNGDPWTIGYGQTGSSIRFGSAWTEDQARGALMTECRQRWSAIKKLVTAPLAIPQAVALISFVYNLGEGNFAASTLRRKINAGDYSGAAGEFDKWVNAGGQRMTGLVTRRAAERALFESALGGELVRLS